MSAAYSILFSVFKEHWLIKMFSSSLLSVPSSVDPVLEEVFFFNKCLGLPLKSFLDLVLLHLLHFTLPLKL
jgi:hypothetical protein